MLNIHRKKEITDDKIIGALSKKKKKMIGIYSINLFVK